MQRPPASDEPCLERTALRVAQRYAQSDDGAAFEATLRQRNARDPRFAFLDAAHPQHRAYVARRDAWRGAGAARDEAWWRAAARRAYEDELMEVTPGALAEYVAAAKGREPYAGVDVGEVKKVGGRVSGGDEARRLMLVVGMWGAALVGQGKGS